MCKKIIMALLVLLLPATMWADLLHPSISPVGLPILPGFNVGGTGHSSEVQVIGSSTSEGSNIANVTVTSTQLSFNGIEGATQEAQNDMSVDYSGTGSLQINEGNSILPILPVSSASMLGFGNTIPIGLGLGLGSPSLGTIGLNNMMNASLLGLSLQTSMPMFIGQPGMSPIIILP